MRGSMPSGFTLLATLAVGLLGPREAAAEAPFVRIVSESATIAADRAVADLLVVDGRLRLDGVVRGHLYTVGADVALGPDAIVLGEVDVVGGRLAVADGAQLPPNVRLVGVEAPEALGAVAPALSAPALAHLKATLTFDRFAPGPKASVKDLRAWHPARDLEVKRFVESPEKLVVGGVTRLSFTSDEVQGSFQRGYRGARGSVMLTGIHFASAEGADRLFHQIHALEDRLAVERSVASTLGAGAHWAYRKKGRTVMLWQRGAWFFSVETLASTPEDERALMTDVLLGLRRGLSPIAGSTPLSRGHR